MLTELIKIPTNCPCCNSTLELVNDQLFCRNKSCDAQLSKKLEHFAKTLGIKGLGTKTLEKLSLSGLEEIFYVDLDDLTAAIGSSKVSEKLLEEVDKAKNADLHVVLASFSIPLIGETASKKICAVIEVIDDITAEKCKEAGLGEKATNNLLDWLNTEFKEIREFLPFTFKVGRKPNKSNDAEQTVCITGKLTSYKNKSEAHAALILAGFTPVESVTKTLKFLVDEVNDGSSKRLKAEQYGITIIPNLNQFLQGTQ
jgi:NAD-dependent DNA ligase